MCRNIKNLRSQPVTADEIHEAALQYVRKVSGFRKPSRANAALFESTVEEVARVTGHMLEHLVVRGRP